MALVDTLNAKAPPLRMDADGVVRVGGTRVTLDTVVWEYENGASAEEVVLHYPTLDLADAYAVFSYYLQNCAEVDVYLAERRKQAEEVRRENERRFPPNGVRERLLARRAI